MVTNLYPPYVHGGAELYVYQIAQRLCDEHDISIITTAPFSKDAFSKTARSPFDHEGHQSEAIYRFYPLNLYSSYYYSGKPVLVKPFWHAVDVWNPHTYAYVKDVLKQERPDLVHVHNFKGLSASVFSATKDLRIPTIHTVHDYNLICPKTTMLTRANEWCTNPHSLCQLYRWISRRVAPAVIIAPSNFVLHTLSRFGVFTAVQKKRLPLGIEGGDAVAKVNNGTFDILYVGRLGTHKGVNILIESVMDLDLDSARLHVVGKGEDRMRFQRAAHDDARIIFHGFLAPAKLRELYGITDVAVVPSIYSETFGLVIPEYYWQGIPVLGSRAGAIPELISDGYNGFLFPPGNVEALRALLKVLSSDSKLLAKLSENARTSAATFDMSVHIDKLEEIYEGVLG
jgi:glycosyltransferase involved in cell wall biosynthesis